MLSVERTVWKEQYDPEDLEEVPCPLCRGTETRERAGQFGLRVVRCTACGLHYVSPRVRDPEKNYWGDPGLIERKYAPIFDGRRPHPRDGTYREHLRVLSAFRGAGHLLDVGTHCGFFLRQARAEGWEVLGVEPSPTNAALARQKYGLPVITAYLHDAGLPAAAFDVVTLVDVLEHVTDPRTLLTEVHRVLRPGGVVYIKTPNVAWNFLKYRVLGRTLRRTRYDFFDIREHVVQYSQTSLTRMLRQCNFRPVVWYIPRPIQSGTLWTQAARMISSVLARGILGLGERIAPLSPDLAVVARKGEHPPSGVARR